MVRTQRTRKGAKKNIVLEQRITRSKSIETKDIKSGKIVNRSQKTTENNLSPRKTRSNSLKAEAAQPKQRACSSHNISPINTRSKSQNIPTISTKSNSIEYLPQKLPKERKTQSKISALSKIQFVKLRDLKVDSVVLAKQKYSIPWPAKVNAIGKEKILVHFFGDRRSGYVQKTEIYDYILSGNAVKSKVLSKNVPLSYLTGISEVEILLGVPREKSILNNL